MSEFSSEIFHSLVEIFSIYLNRHVFVMIFYTGDNLSDFLFAFSGEDSGVGGGGLAELPLTQTLRFYGKLCINLGYRIYPKYSLPLLFT